MFRVVNLTDGLVTVSGKNSVRLVLSLSGVKIDLGSPSTFDGIQVIFLGEIKSFALRRSWMNFLTKETVFKSPIYHSLSGFYKARGNSFFPVSFNTN